MTNSRFGFRVNHPPNATWVKSADWYGPYTKCIAGPGAYTHNSDIFRVAPKLKLHYQPAIPFDCFLNGHFITLTRCRALTLKTGSRLVRGTTLDCNRTKRCINHKGQVATTRTALGWTPDGDTFTLT